MCNEKINCIHSPNRKELLFTPAEVGIILLIASGYSNEHISERLVITNNTVKAHLTTIYSKINIPPRFNKRVYIAINSLKLTKEKYYENC